MPRRAQQARVQVETTYTVMKSLDQLYSERVRTTDQVMPYRWYFYLHVILGLCHTAYCIDI